jgi:hypothetical protein
MGARRRAVGFLARHHVLVFTEDAPPAFRIICDHPT